MEIATVSTARKVSDAPRPTKGGPFFQAIPLYRPSDEKVANYIRHYRKELGDLTGDDLNVVLIDALGRAETDWMKTVFAGDRVSPRYPGLTRTDLPCLWFEDGLGGHAVIRLENANLAIADLLAGVTQACVGAASAAEVAARFNLWADSKNLDKSAYLGLLREQMMRKSTERLIATLFGVAFVAALLVLAVFIPNPTQSQADTFRIVLSIAAAGFVSMVPGFLDVSIGGWARAGGALAVFLLVFLVNPASRGIPVAAPAATTAPDATAGG